MAEAGAMEKLREQRDRFIAFAFAAADVLLEVRPSNVVSFCAGASDTLFGLPNEKILGRSLFDLVEPSDHPTLREALRRLQGSGRLDRLRLTFQSGGSDRPLPLTMSGMLMPSRRNVMHIALSRPSMSPSSTTSDRPVGTADFVAMVESRARGNPGADDSCTLTLLDLSGASTDGGEAGDAAAFLASVEGYLRAWSLGGDSVGRLEDNKFGILHDKSVSQGQLEKRICDIAREMAPDAPVAVRAATVTMARGGLGPDDVAKALVYTINQFLTDDGRGSWVGSLLDGYQAAVNDTLSKVTAFRDTIAGEALTVVFQPIVCLYTYDVHHFEVLARVAKKGGITLPTAFIGFAEQLGVVHELDLVVTRRALGILRDNLLIPPGAKIAINISGNSVGNPAFGEELLRVLGESADLAPRLLFELTETAELKNLEQANTLLQKLRRMGCAVCLDDFGAGASAFQYLRALQVDYVKIDGSYILDAFDSRHGRPFLKAMANLCRELKILTIGEMVEDERSAKLLRDVGLDYGQGFFFARPQPDVSKLKMQSREGTPSPRRILASQ